MASTGTPAGSSIRCMEAIDHVMTIKDIATKHNLPVSRIAAEIGIPQRTIERWAAGDRTPPDYVLRLVEFYLDHRAEQAETK